jgi:hypothetical protein
LSKDEEIIVSRSQFVVTESLKGPLRPGEVINGLLMPEARFRHVAEDLGLCRIFRGYENVAAVEWVSYH